MSQAGATIYLVDDDPSVRKSVSRLLQSAGYLVDTFGTAEEFLAVKRVKGPGCVVLDLQMPGINGLELQKVLIAAGRAIPLVFISGHADIPTSVRAMKDGAIDFLPKPFAQKELLAAVEGAIEKGLRDQKIKNEMSYVQFRADKLTPRERQVLIHVVAGRLNKQVAIKLRISEKTVKVHRARVMEKMRAGSLAELVRLTEKANLTINR